MIEISESAKEKIINILAEEKNPNLKLPIKLVKYSSLKATLRFSKVHSPKFPLKAKKTTENVGIAIKINENIKNGIKPE